MKPLRSPARACRNSPRRDTAALTTPTGLEPVYTAYFRGSHCHGMNYIPEYD